jgi:hypothetical protein
MQTRGKRKRILADDEADGGTEDLLQSDVASQAILGVDNSADDRTAEQAGGDIPSRVNYFRGRREQSFKRLRTSKPPHLLFLEQSTQDFLMTENNVTDEETSNRQNDKENLKEQRDLVRKANQCANQRAADAFLARLEERFYIDGAAQNDGMGVIGQSKDPVNVEEISAEVNRRKERNNAVHFQHRNAKKHKRSDNISKTSDSIILESLRLIMGKDKGSSQDNNQAHGQGTSDNFRADNAICTIICDYSNPVMSSLRLANYQLS